MFNKYKRVVEKALGIKVNFKTEFGRLQAELINLHKKFPPTATTKIEIAANHAADQKAIKKNGDLYNQEMKALNEKYKKLDQDLVIAGMKREIELVKHANTEQFTVEVNK